MKKILPSLILILALLLTLLTPLASAEKAAAAATPAPTATPAPAETNGDGLTVPTITAKDVVLVDLDTGKMIYERNKDAKAYPASLTKMMTVLLAVQAVEAGSVKLTDKVAAYDDCRQGLTDDSSTADIVPGEVLTLEQLLYCALIASANEACNIIAEYVGGSISAFVDQMNAEAKKLGCTGTHFANPDGMPDDDHYTTAYDLYLIAREAMTHDLFATICNTQSYTVPGTNYSDARTLYNSNALISGKGTYGSGYIYDYAEGVKTGYTSAAGYCLVSTAEKNGIRLMCVVLGCPSQTRNDGSTRFCDFTDSISLYDWVFTNYKYYTVYSTDDLVTEVKVQYAPADNDTVNLRPAADVSVLVPSTVTKDAFGKTVTLYGDPVAPIDAGTALGEMTVTVNGQAAGTVKLLAAASVDLSEGQYMKEQLHGTFSRLWVKIVFWLLIFVILLYVSLVARYRMLRQKHLRDRRRAQAERAKAREREATERIFRRSPPPKMEYFTEDDMKKPAGPRLVPPGGVDKSQKDYFDEFFRKEEEGRKKKK
ncbi:MAG: D-alanyl-D-alanine carboxypeptidase family protein [Oscillospiraceae bacterium]|nr:D-alanyl-D-alanine carboxypeptidase family protein [Oscillospiraceae bacterium]